MTSTTTTRYVTHTETNKFIRAALKQAFPGVTFRVNGSGGNATNVRWTDGPDEKSVENVARRFEGMSFDGMQDLASPIFDIVDGERVHYGASYVFCRRVCSEEITAEAEEIVAAAGIDPHGLNTLSEVPATLTRFPAVWQMIGMGYPADGPQLVRSISHALADARWEARA